eukprot:444807-Karenia_brevis.AAC.1
MLQTVEGFQDSSYVISACRNFSSPLLKDVLVHELKKDVNDNGKEGPGERASLDHPRLED